MGHLVRHEGYFDDRSELAVGNSLRHRSIPAEERNIFAFWNVDPDGIVLASNQIISLERSSQPSRLDPNNRIVLVESLVALEYLYRYRITFDAFGTAR